MEYYCTICEKPIKEDEIGWSWGEEDAHMECVLRISNRYCEKCVFYYLDNGEDGCCPECRGEGMAITIEMVEEIFRRERGLYKPKIGDRAVCAICHGKVNRVDQEWIDQYNKTPDDRKQKLYEICDGKYLALCYDGCEERPDHRRFD